MAETSATVRPFLDRWLVLIAACLGAFVVTSNSTAVMTAVPDIGADLDLSTLTGQWVINIYSLSTAVLVIIFGRFSDIFGKFNIFKLGLGVFAAGSLAIIVTDNIIILMIGRLAQGIGAAGLMSSSVALVDVTTEKSKRSMALGIWAGMTALGLGGGPLVAGALIAATSWRGVFAVDLVLIAVVAVLCVRIAWLKLITPTQRKAVPIDYIGSVLLVVALSPFVYGLSAAQTAGWISTQTLGLFAITVAGAVAFAVRERYAVEPLVYFSFFRHPRFIVATFGAFVCGVVFGGLFYFFSLYAQSSSGLGYTALGAGAAILPFTVPTALLSITVPHLVEKISLRWPITIGMLLMAAGMWLLSQTTAEMTYADLWWRLLFVGAGTGVVYPLMSIVGLRALPEEHAGQGSGIIVMCIFMGLSVGLPAGGTLLGIVRHDALAATIGGLSNAPANALQWVHDLAHGSAIQVKQVLTHFSTADAAKINETLNTLGASEFAGIMMLFMIVALIGAVTSFVLIRPQLERAAAPHTDKRG